MTIFLHLTEMTMIDYTHSRHVSKNNVPTKTHKCSVQMLITPFMESLVHVRKRVFSWYLKSQAVVFASWNQSLVFFSWSKLLSSNDLSTLCFTLLLSSSMKQELLHLHPGALADRKWNLQRKYGEWCLMSNSHQIIKHYFFQTDWLEPLNGCFIIPSLLVKILKIRTVAKFLHGCTLVMWKEGDLGNLNTSDFPPFISSFFFSIKLM